MNSVKIYVRAGRQSQSGHHFGLNKN